MKIRKTFIKLLISILIVLTLFNFIGSINMSSNYIFADTADEGEERVNELSKGTSGNLVDIVFDGIVSLLINIPRAMRSLNFALAASDTGTQGAATQKEITPFDIFFNRFPLLDANIFSTTNRDGQQLPQDSIVYKIRTSSAVWYYGIRTIAIAVVSIMLIWNITAALSKTSSANQKVAAKNAIVDWVLSFALIMFMHIIVILILNLNDLFLRAIEGFTPAADTSDFIDALENAVFNNNNVLKIAALIVYFVLEWQTFKYILLYIQRLLTIVLLVMISPLVPVTYSFDRMRGGRGQALNGWLRELLYNVFIQVLHALVYSAFVGIAMASLTSSSITGVGDLSKAVIAITAMLFIKYAERMVKAIFGFDNSQILNTNVFMNSVSTVANFARSSAVGISRMASGQSPIGFGQNLDTQTNKTSTFSKIGESITNTINGGVKSSNQAIRNTGGGLGGFIESRMSSSQSNSQISSSSTETTIDENGVERGNADVLDENGDVIADAGYSIKDEQQDKKLRRLNYDENRNKQEINKRFEEEEESKKKLLEDTIKNVQENNQKKNEEENNKKENKEEKKEVKETKEEKVVEETEEEQQGEDIDHTPMYDGLSPELKSTINMSLKSIKDKDTEKLEKISQQLSDELNGLKEKIGEEKAEEIENNVNKNWDDQENLARYLNSLKDPLEREYGEKFAMFGATMGIDNINDKNQKEQEDSINNIAQAISKSHSNEEQEINKDNIGVNREENRPDFQAPAVSSGVARVQEEVINASKEEMKENGETPDITSTTTVEVKPDFEINKLNDENLKEAMVELSKIDPIKYRINGRSETEIENDIEEEFEATLKEFTKENGSEPKNLREIYQNMDKKARDQYSQYKTGDLDPKKLTGDAKALATLEIQARRLNYKMDVGKFSSESKAPVEIQFNADGGDVKTVTGNTTSEATKKVLADLQSQARNNNNNNTANSNIITFNQNQDRRKNA